MIRNIKGNSRLESRRRLMEGVNNIQVLVFDDGKLYKSYDNSSETIEDLNRITYSNALNIFRKYQYEYSDDRIIAIDEPIIMMRPDGSGEVILSYLLTVPTKATFTNFNKLNTNRLYKTLDIRYKISTPTVY